ncbi:MAG: hypothetical protein HZA14_08370 [Nitrospirae bacterium]|nr:hypothetical protein [Nitrospirota bacterium]
MDFPSEYIAKNLSGFCVCYFKNTTHDPEAPPHYHVTVPISDDSSLLLCFITSQIENKAWYYHKTRETAESCLVLVGKDDLPFLKKASIIDCNQPQLIHKNKFEKLIDSDHKFEVVSRNIPKEIRGKIVKAIKASPIVKPFIKKLIRYP